MDVKVRKNEEFNHLPLDRAQRRAVLNTQWTIGFQKRPGISLLMELVI
jgi:uncharacterized protein (DUF2344 family)